MEVVVTRPEISALKTARKLRLLGHEPLMLPLFSPRHDADALRAALRQPTAGLILTSAEALRALASSGTDLEPLAGLPVFAVGAATGRHASALGFRSVHCAEGTADDLVRLVAASAAGSPARLLYVAGEPRKPDLENGLASLAIPLRSVTAYRMAPLDISRDALQQLVGASTMRAVLLYSRQAALRLQQVIAEAGNEPSLEGLRFYCLSPDIADALTPRLRQQAIISPVPQEDALLACLPAA